MTLARPQDITESGPVALPGAESVVLALTEGSRYAHAMARLTQALLDRRAYGVIVCANRPAEAVRVALARAGVDLRGLRFVDCISSTAGLPPPPDASTVHVESPTMLEKVALRAEQWLRRLPGPGFLLVDALSTLAVYNGSRPVAEFVHTLVLRLRTLHTPGAFLLVERQAPPDLTDLVRPQCDGVVHL